MSGGGGTTTSTVQQQLTPEQSQLLRGVAPIAQAYIQNPPKAYGGALTAPVSPQTTQGQNMALGAAMGPIQAQTQQALAGSQWLTSGQALDPRSNPYEQAAINAAIKPITQNFQENVMPGISNQAMAAGQYGYNRQALETNQAMRDYLQSVGSTSAGMANQDYQAGLNAMTSALYSAPQIAQAGALPSEMVGAVGLQRQQMQQQAIDAAMQQYYTSQFLPLTIAQQIASMAFGMPGGGSIGQQQGAGTSTLQGILGGLTGAAGLGSALLGSGGLAGLFGGGAAGDLAGGLGAAFLA